MDIFPLKTRVRANLISNFSPAFLRARMRNGHTRLRHMRDVIMDAFAALSPEQTQAVKDFQQSAGHKGQIRAVIMHRCDHPPSASIIRALQGPCLKQPCLVFCLPDGTLESIECLAGQEFLQHLQPMPTLRTLFHPIVCAQA